MPFLIFYKIYDIIYIDRKEKKGKMIGTIERRVKEDSGLNDWRWETSKLQ